MSADLHVVFGAGQVGWPLARLLAESGHRVRIVKRSAAEPLPGVEVVQGDAGDRAFSIQAAQGAAAVYHCLNPPYDSKIWAAMIPRYVDNLVEAAGRTGARLVVLDNVYMLGRPGGRPLDEETPPNPCSRKGQIRAAAAERLFDAHRRGDVQAVSGRAADYYGPRGTQTFLGDQFWPRALTRKTVWLLNSPDAIHTYHYIPDVAAGLATLGSAPGDVCGRPWMLPCSPATSTRTLIDRFARALDQDIKLAEVPRWLLTLAGTAVPLLREVNEMLYQWDEPFVISDRRFRERFQQEPADVHLAAAATVEWAKRHYTTTPGA